MSDHSPSNMSKDFQIETLQKEVEELKREVATYKKTLESYDIDEIEEMSDVEYICVEEIKKLKAFSDSIGLNDFQVKNLDVLHKNLRMIRGNVSKKKPKGKSKTVDELLQIVNGGKD